MNISRLTLKLLVKIIVLNALSLSILLFVLKVLGFEFSSFFIFVLLLSGVLIDVYFKTREPAKSFFKNGICTITNKVEDCDKNCISCTLSVKYK